MERILSGVQGLCLAWFLNTTIGRSTFFFFGKGKGSKYFVTISSFSFHLIGIDRSDIDIGNQDIADCACYEVDYLALDFDNTADLNKAKTKKEYVSCIEHVRVFH